MANRKLPVATFLISGLTLAVSVAVAIKFHGKPWSTVTIAELREFGGITNAQIASGEWWRFITAQLVHVKQGHMIFNVIALYLLGGPVERTVSWLKFILIWLISGAIGTYASICFVTPPWDVGTGASQALMGIAASAFLVLRYKYSHPKWLKLALIIVVGFSLVLDLIFAHYPKPGHVVGFLVGYLLSFLWLRPTQESI